MRIEIGSAVLDTGLRQLTRDGKEVPLTQLEYKLLLTFYRHPNRALSRDFLLNEAWGIDYLGTTRTLDQHLSQLRRKIEPEPAKPRYLLTVHGYGYRFAPDAEVR